MGIIRTDGGILIFSCHLFHSRDFFISCSLPLMLSPLPVFFYISWRLSPRRVLKRDTRFLRTTDTLANYTEKAKGNLRYQRREMMFSSLKNSSSISFSLHPLHQHMSCFSNDHLAPHDIMIKNPLSLLMTSPLPPYFSSLSSCSLVSCDDFNFTLLFSFRDFHSLLSTTMSSSIMVVKWC